jgi:formylglycine-generating enzyme required for sulfatase activity
LSPNNPFIRAAYFSLVLFSLFLSGCESGYQSEILIPEGKFLLGLEPNSTTLQFMSDQTASRNAGPMQDHSLPRFYIDRHEVRYEEFLRFKPTASYKGASQSEPIRGVSWFEADAYCSWLGKRLPSEFEWERAARGADGRLFTWGNEFQKEKANFGKKVVAVEHASQDISPSGAVGMNGNVSEWTSSWYLPYPASKMVDDNFGRKFKVIRGGGIKKRKHGFLKRFAMLPFRNIALPDQRFWDTGFRCAHS